jgi:squalene cyclase
VERHLATWDLAGRTAILQGVGEMEAGSGQCKESEDENLLRVVGRWIEKLSVDGLTVDGWKLSIRWESWPVLSRRTGWVEEDGM